jgi:hypothetical protein
MDGREWVQACAAALQGGGEETPRTSSAEEVPESSLVASLRLRSTHGKWFATGL